VAVVLEANALAYPISTKSSERVTASHLSEQSFCECHGSSARGQSCRSMALASKPSEDKTALADYCIQCIDCHSDMT